MATASLRTRIVSFDDLIALWGPRSDRLCKRVDKYFKIGRGHQFIDDPNALSSLRSYEPGGEKHLLGDSQVTRLIKFKKPSTL
jgi:hypothetical protein